MLAEDTAVADPVLEDVRLDLLGGRAPRRLQLGIASNLGELGRAIHRDPAHELRRHVVLRRAARLPDALVGVLPDRRRTLGLRLDDRPQPAREPLAAAGMEEERVENGAVDVVLPLVEGAVADPDGTRSRVAREVVERRLGQVSPTVDPVHDLQRAVLVRLDVRDELHELVGLPVEVQVVERLEGERRVSHPRVAVVPVALAARRLGERCRQRRDGRPGRHVGQPLDRERRPLHRVAPAMVGDAGSAEPRSPEAHRRGEPGLGVVDVLRAGQPFGPGQGAVRLVTRLQDMPCPHAAALDAEREIRPEADRLSRSRRVGDVPTALDERPRRLLATVVEDGLADQLDLDVSFEALDRAHEHVVGVVVRRRARVRRDLVLVVPRAPWSARYERRSSRSASSRSSRGHSSRARTRAPSDGRSRTAQA